jgi:hypothetical protein
MEISNSKAPRIASAQGAEWMLKSNLSFRAQTGVRPSCVTFHLIFSASDSSAGTDTVFNSSVESFSAADILDCLPTSSLKRAMTGLCTSEIRKTFFQPQPLETQKSKMACARDPLTSTNPVLGYGVPL